MVAPVARIRPGLSIALNNGCHDGTGVVGAAITTAGLMAHIFSAGPQFSYLLLLTSYHLVLVIENLIDSLQRV